VSRPIVSLLTDFGLRDPSPAICHGVILGIAPDVTIVDVSHEVAKFAIRDGAFVLALALPFLPRGVHVAVVDPGVGTERRPIAVRVGRGDVLVGPDNGLLRPAAERLGGLVEAREVANRALMRPEISASFHGRDIFAPVAAHLAAGAAAFEDVGPLVEPSGLVALELGTVVVGEDRLRTSVVYRDTFGNVKLAGTPADLDAAVGPLREGLALVLRAGIAPTPAPVAWRTTFGLAGAGEPLLYEDSYGRLCLAVNRGSAVARFGLDDDDPIEIARA
jgi:S-adenosylmethionine hydrolase